MMVVLRQGGKDMIHNAVVESFIPFKGYNVWYRAVGDCEEPSKLPLLCLHGTGRGA